MSGRFLVCGEDNKREFYWNVYSLDPTLSTFKAKATGKVAKSLEQLTEKGWMYKEQAEASGYIAREFPLC